MQWFQKLINYFLTPLKFKDAASLTPLQIAIYIVVPLVTLFLGFWLFKVIRRKVTGRSRLDDISGIWAILFRTMVFVSLIILFNVAFKTQLSKYLLGFVTLLNHPIYSSGSTKISILTLVMIIPVLYLSTWIGKKTGKFFYSYSFGRVQIEDSRKSTISKVISYIVIFFLSVILLSLVGVDLSAIGIIFGLFGLGIGLGLQDSVANFFAGLIIIFARPFKERDRIIFNDIEGEVLEIRFLTTTVDTWEKGHLIIPNAKLTSTPIHNYSKDNTVIMVINSVTVDYQSDADMVESILFKIGKASPFGDPDLDPKVKLVSFADNGLIFELRTFIKDPKAKFDVKTANNMEILKQFRSNLIRMPYSRQDISILNEKININLVKDEDGNDK